MHHVAVLTLALAAARHGPGPVRLAALARDAGVDVFAEIHAGLAGKERARIQRRAESLARTSVFAVLMGSEDYPARLLAARAAPAFLFCRGVRGLLAMPGLAICGSGAASASGVAAARACAAAAADLGLCTIGGDAPGVGLSSHVASLRSGGRTVLVVAEGIERFRLRRGKLTEAWDPARTLVVSPFAPSQRATAATEIVQHTVILGMGRALLVIEPRETGTTLATGMRASATGRPVLAIPSAGTPRGMAMLLRRGAIPIHTPDELTSTLDTLPDDQPRRHPLLII
ncbi:MAG TPA: DNA-processing protein DprA [Mycobacteriales bacterium]|nr:DNA-processing protein DprA [Mycobacteriales bacterium]